MLVKRSTPVETWIYSDYLNGEGRWAKSIPGESIHTAEIEAMCVQYPTLEKAYRNFLNVYSMCVDDYEKKEE